MKATNGKDEKWFIVSTKSLACHHQCVNMCMGE